MLSNPISNLSANSLSSGSIRDHLDTSNHWEGTTVIQNSYAYIAGGRKGLIIIDISDPLNPEAVGNLHFDKNITFSSLNCEQVISVNRNYAYITDEDDNNFLIVDVHQPQTPQVVGALHYPYDNAYDCLTTDSRAYLSCKDTGVIII